MGVVWNRGRKVVCAAIALWGFSMSPSWALAPTEVGKLRATDVVRGGDVAVDGTTAVVGAPDDGRGAAYLFGASSSGVWHQLAELVPDDGGDGDRFGVSVAIDRGIVVVGAEHDVRADGGRGSVYVFTREDGGWVQQARLVPANPTPADDSFGTEVAVDGDTIVVGSPHEVPGYGEGFVFVFTQSGGGWVQQARLTPDEGAFDIDSPLAIDGDTIVVGSPLRSDGERSAFVFVRSAGAWTQQATLRGDPDAGIDLFGLAVSVSGDTAVVGAPFDGSAFAGAAYVFERANGAWSRQAKLLPLRGFSGEHFGHAVAIDGNRIVVGAPLHRAQGANSGAAYAFVRSGGTWVSQGKLLVSDGQPDDQFGNAAAVSGTTAVIGIRAADISKNRGSALVYSLIERSRVFSPGDLDGDRVPELAALTPQGNVVVADTGNRVLQRFSFGGPGNLLDAELLPDVDQNGTPELAVLTRAILPNVPEPQLTAEVRDLLTGALVSSVSFKPGYTAFDLEVIPDMSGNGAPKLALLSRGGYNQGRHHSIKVQVRDVLGTTETTWRTFTRFTRHPVDLAIYPDVDGNGSPELAVMGDYLDAAASDPLEMVDLATGNLLKQVGMGRGWTLLQHMAVADFNGNGAPELTVLRANADGAVSVRIRDARTREQLTWVGFNRRLMPVRMLALDDMNANGSDELVVFGQRFAAANREVLATQAAQIRDSRTRQKLGNLYFSSNVFGEDLVTIPDIDGNGSPELVLLGHRQRDGRLVGVIKDIATRARIGLVEL